MERIATAFCSFELLRKRYTYIDKTDLLGRLVSDSEDRIFFISRPRRFGKSLMLDTLKCIFEGRRDLFKGLKIEKRRYDWKKYPVVMLDMSSMKGETPDELKANIQASVAELAARFGCGKVQRQCTSPGKTFGSFLDALYAKGGEYVVLVDEYDVPLQGFLGDAKAVKRVRAILHDFYMQLKTHSGQMRFLMMTGVTKLTRMSVFSGLNNLKDLTMSGRYATLFGYTPTEIEAAYPKRLDAFARKQGTDREGALRKLLDWYDSYRFSPDSAKRVCNPISIGLALESGILQSYWVRTASATLVMERMAAAGKTPADFEGCTATVSELDVCDALELPAKALMYQSGYLTIKGLSKTEVDEVGNPKLVLGAPNHEVRGAIRSGWFNSVIRVPATEFDALADVAKRQVAAGDLGGLVGESLYRIYAKIPPEWRIRSEADVKRHFRLFMEMLGAKVAAEEGSAFGYADAIIETRKSVWIFEFKFNKSASAAVRQIREKRYADPYKGDRRPVTLVGINFRLTKRNIDEPVFERLRS